MKEVGIAGIGLIAPGIECWNSGREMLASGDAYDIHAELPPLKTEILSANERRRTTGLINLALLAAQDALSAIPVSEIQASALTSVFACSHGDLNIVDKILSALCLPGKPVSPTHFHNSVHNAPAGYWSIGMVLQSATTSIAAGGATFSAGLLEAMSQLLSDTHPVLLVGYDTPAPATFSKHTNVSTAFGVAMLLVPEPNQYSLSISIEESEHSLSSMADSGLEQLRQANPAALCLPFLQQLALRQPATIQLPYLHGQRLQLELTIND